MNYRMGFMLIFGIIVTFSGCASNTLQPTHVPLGRYDMVQVRSYTPIALINGEKPGPSMVKVGQADMETDLSMWSFQAIATIGSWLTYYKVHVSPEAMKQIKVSIADPSVHLKKHLPCAVLTLKIETENGLRKEFPAEGCASTNNRAVGHAISYAVIDMIRDRDMTDYIEERRQLE